MIGPTRSVSGGFEYFDYDNDGRMDLYVANNSQPNVLYPNNGTVVFEEASASVGLNQAGNQVTGNGNLYLNTSAGLWLRGSVGTTENFMRIGHSLVALILAFMGGQLSRNVYGKNREQVRGSVNSMGSTSDSSGD